MPNELALALLRSIVSADAAFAEAAELLNIGAIDQDRYQTAAERFHATIDRAAELLQTDFLA